MVKSVGKKMKMLSKINAILIATVILFLSGCGADPLDAKYEEGIKQMSVDIYKAKKIFQEIKKKKPNYKYKGKSEIDTAIEECQKTIKVFEARDNVERANQQLNDSMNDIEKPFGN